MFGTFLIEAGGILQSSLIIKIGEEFVVLSDKWDDIADTMWELSETCNLLLLDSMSCGILELYKKEIDLLTKLFEIFK